MFKSTASDEDYFSPSMRRTASKSNTASTDSPAAASASSINIAFIGSEIYKQGFLEVRLMSGPSGSGSIGRNRRGSVWSGYKTQWCVLTEKGIYFYDDPSRTKCRTAIEFSEGVTVSEQNADTSLSVDAAQGAFVLISEATGTTQFKSVDSSVKYQWLQSLDDARTQKPFWTVNCTLDVELLEAKDLDAKDMNGKSDPYCFLIVEHGCRQSSIKYKTLTPVYNEKFSFETTRLPTEVNVVMYDHDRLSASDFMGVISIPVLTGRSKGDVNDWVPLRPRREGQTVNGKVKIRITTRFAESELNKLTLGISLGSFMSRQENQSRVVPDVAFNCIRFLNNALDTEGVFRVPGNNTLIKSLELKLDRGELIDYSLLDAHDVASFIKAYLRDLPEPLIGKDYYNHMLAVGKLSDEAQIKERLRSVIQQKINSIRSSSSNSSSNSPSTAAVDSLLTSRSFLFLFFMTCLLKKISQRSAVNKMHPANLAVVFGPVFCGNPVTAGADLAANAVAMAQMPAISAAAQNLIAYFYHVFDINENEDPVQDLIDSGNEISRCQFALRMLNA